MANAVRPALIASHAALDVYCDRLVDYAMALTAAEAVRRALPNKPVAKKKTQPTPSVKTSVHPPSLSRRSKPRKTPT